MNATVEGFDPKSARELFGLELRRLRHLRGMSQKDLASLVVHSRSVIATVEPGGRWPPKDLAVRGDEVLYSDGALTRLWPLVEAERQAAREILSGVRSRHQKYCSASRGAHRQRPDRAHRRQPRQ